MTSVETGKILEEIGKKYEFVDEKIKEMAYQTGLVLLEMESFTGLYTKLREKLAVSEEIAIAIANDINKQILYKVESGPAQDQNKNRPAGGEVSPQREGGVPAQEKQDRNKIVRIKRGLEQNKTERITDILRDTDKTN